MHTHFWIVASNVCCCFDSPAFLPRFALGDEPEASFLRFLPAGGDLGCGGEELLDCAASRAEERRPVMLGLDQVSTRLWLGDWMNGGMEEWRNGGEYR